MRRGIFVLVILAPTAAFALIALSFNAYVDPLWMMPKMGTRSWLHYCVEDERTNKINRAVFGHLSARNVLLGSSRSAFFDTRAFRQSTFNMSVNGVRPLELPILLRIFSENVTKPDTVYLGLDFYGYLKEPGDEIMRPQLIARETTSVSRFYRLRNLVDWSLFEYSRKTVERCSVPGFAEPTYDYDGIRFALRAIRDPKLLAEQRKFFAEELYGKQVVEPNYKQYLLDVKTASSGSRIVAYIPPITTELFAAIVEKGRLPDYIDWLRIVVDVFGSVRQFSGRNAFTEDASNFYDMHHVYADRTIPAVRILDGQDEAKVGFGRLLTKDNVDAYAAELKD